MKRVLSVFLFCVLWSGCESPFEINPAPAAQVIIALYDGIPARIGHTLTAEIPDLSDLQKSNMAIQYTWYRDDAVAAFRAETEHPQSGTDAKYTVKEEDFGKTIKVKASFMYNGSISASYAVLDINVTTAHTFEELEEWLAKSNNVNYLEITTSGDFAISGAISVPANVSLKINSAVTADSNVTVQGKMIVGTGALTVNPSKNIALAAGSVFTVESGGNVYLDGTFDNANGTIVNNGTITLNNNAALAAEPVWGTRDTGKYIVNQGGRISGLIGAGGIIDNNSQASVVTLAANSVELTSGAVTIINDWTISDSLTVNSGSTIYLNGRTITVNSGGNVYLNGTFDNTNGTIVNNGTITLNAGATLAAEPVWRTADTGKYIVNQGGRIPGFIGAGGVIDNNSQASVVTLARSGVELTSGVITVIDDWIISDTLTVNGKIIVDTGKDIKGEGMEANSNYRIIVKPGAAVTGGAGALNLSEGIYTWNGSAWSKVMN